MKTSPCFHLIDRFIMIKPIAFQNLRVLKALPACGLICSIRILHPRDLSLNVLLSQAIQIQDMPRILLPKRNHKVVSWSGYRLVLFRGVKPSDGNQHRKKKLPLLIAKAINSLPHKSFRFCSPMQNRWKPGHETIRWKPGHETIRWKPCIYIPQLETSYENYIMKISI